MFGRAPRTNFFNFIALLGARLTQQLGRGHASQTLLGLLADSALNSNQLGLPTGDFQNDRIHFFDEGGEIKRREGDRIIWLLSMSRAK